MLGCVVMPRGEINYTGDDELQLFAEFLHSRHCFSAELLRDVCVSPGTHEDHRAQLQHHKTNSSGPFLCPYGENLLSLKQKGLIHVAYASLSMLAFQTMCKSCYEEHGLVQTRVMPECINSFLSKKKAGHLSWCSSTVQLIGLLALFH